MRPDLEAAATWNRIESLEATSARIHDGAVGDEKLRRRADTYIQQILFGPFPYALPQAGGEVLEIGSGVGWIMEAMKRFLDQHGTPPRRIVGLDIAPNMIAKARQRIGDAVPFAFLQYDGLSVPLPDASCDLIYSVACLQHVPRPYVFNLFFEIKRLLQPNGFSVLHLMSTGALRTMESIMPWREEIRNQIEGRETHWHHYYTGRELTQVLDVTGFGHVAIRDDRGGTLVVCMSRSRGPVLGPHLGGHGDFTGLEAGNAGLADAPDQTRERPSDAAAPDVPRLLERIRQLENEVRASRSELLALAVERDTLAHECGLLRNSTSWRVTRPLRRLKTLFTSGTLGPGR